MSQAPHQQHDLASYSRASAVGKKTRNPGYQPGNYWVLCDRCGMAIRASDAKMTWNGFFVCPKDWEIRNEQDFVRGRQDRIAPEGPVRPDNGDGILFIPSFCTTNTCICDVAIVDCAFVDNTLRQAYTSQIPPGTFGGL